MNIKNRLIPVILFATAICLAVYYYAALSPIAVFNEGLSPDIYRADYNPPMRLIFTSISFFIVFIILGTLQNRVCNPVWSGKTRSKEPIRFQTRQTTKYD